MRSRLIVAVLVGVTTCVVGCSDSGGDSDTSNDTPPASDRTSERKDGWIIDHLPGGGRASRPTPRKGSQLAARIGCSAFVPDYTGGECLVEHGDVSMYFYPKDGMRRAAFEVFCEAAPGDLGVTYVTGEDWLLMVGNKADVEPIRIAAGVDTDTCTP